MSGVTSRYRKGAHLSFDSAAARCWSLLRAWMIACASFSGGDGCSSTSQLD
jgi:hypothetical protein